MASASWIGSAVVAAVVVVAIVGLGATARAEPRTDAGLVWQAPVACPDAGEVRARIERRLGMPIDRMVHGIEVEIAPDHGDGRGFVARVDLRGITVANEVRVLTSARCDELTDAVAVVIVRLAMEIHAPVVEAVRPRLAVQVPPTRATHAWGGGLRLVGVSGIGALPGVGLGGELAVYGRHRAVFLELAESQWRQSPQVLQPGAPGRVDVSLRTTALRFGWGPEDVPLRVWLGGELGSITGEGVALNEVHVGAATWVSAGAGIGVAWPMTPHAHVVGLVELAVPFQRARFVLQDGTEVFRPDVATARCGLGLELGWR
jgi:hypothetical protein